MRVCKSCGTELREFDDYGNQFWHCPNDCISREVSNRIAKEEAAKSDAEQQADYEDHLAVAGPQAYMKQTHCWNCQTTITRTPQTQDEPYGNFCPKCGESLRNHYYLGEGRPGDLAKMRNPQNP